jgi:hypothetical protein
MNVKETYFHFLHPPQSIGPGGGSGFSRDAARARANTKTSIARARTKQTTQKPDIFISF